MSGFGGILLSALATNGIAVGASTAIFGLVGSYVGALILNWDHLKKQTERRCQMLIFLLVTLFMSVQTFSDPRID